MPVHYETRAQARLDIVGWIDGRYNRHRLHSANGFLIPCDTGEYTLGDMT